MVLLVHLTALTRVHMHNNTFSVFYGGGTLIADISSVQQGNSFPVIQSDISGVWSGPYTTDINKSDLSGGTMLPGSDPSLNMQYGYITNLINIPRNLNGTGIAIDPSNILFPDHNCGIHSYFRNRTNIKTNIVVRGGLNLCGYSSLPNRLL